MLKVGDRAPEIDAMATDGTRFVLSAQGGLCTVIYFFPKAFTPGCTSETKRFRDNHVELALAGARIVGVSTDDHTTQCRFADSLKAPFPMLSDTDHRISRAYDVLWPIIGVARRVTFIVSPEMRIEAVFQHEIDVKKHRDDVLAFVNGRFQATRPPPSASRLPREPAVDPDLAKTIAIAPRQPPQTATALSPGPSEERRVPARTSGSNRPGGQRVIAGKFALEQRAGSGASGDVYRARDQHTGEVVAVKLLRATPAKDDARFAREAQILAELRHPGIVAYVAHGFDADGDAYLVTEWLEGESLAQRLARGMLTVEQTLALGIRIANALGAAHARGVIHRDLKPSNLFLVGGAVEHVKIIDFGISRRASPDKQITAPGDVIGTPGYMAPEQARSRRDVDARADVFALACVLYLCFTGQPAFTSDSAVTFLMRVITDEVPRASDVNPSVPAVVSDLLARMLSKSPDGRPPDGHAVAAELTAIYRSLGALASGRPAAGADGRR